MQGDGDQGMEIRMYNFSECQETIQVELMGFRFKICAPPREQLNHLSNHPSIITSSQPAGRPGLGEAQSEIDSFLIVVVMVLFSSVRWW